MLYFLFYLKEYFILFNVFKYITFRSFGAGVTAFLICIFLGQKFINFLQARKVKESIREDGPSSHKTKSGTPTMGGIFIVLAVIISAVLWVNISNLIIIVILVSMIGFSLIGFLDDWLKLTKNNGMRARVKLLLQMIVGSIFIVLLLSVQEGVFTMSYGVNENIFYEHTSVVFPFLKKAVIKLGIFYIPFALLIIIGTSNAVNFTDGLDGLAIGSIAVAISTYIILAYIAGNSEFSSYLQIPYIPVGGELAVFLSAIGGACLGFLWYNSHPAQVFMGDVGSTTLGAVIGFSAIVIKQELLLVIVGGLFVMEALSVILQMTSFKLTGKRILKMAPLHHHFELSGWSESKVVIRFWIISIVFALMALATLKLR